MRILHLITGLGQGGAENMLLKLVRAQKARGVDSMVVCLVDPSDLLPLFEADGIPVFGLGMKRGMPNPRSIFRLLGLIQSFQPDLVQTWMYHADLLSFVIRLRFPRCPIVWNIRHNNLEKGLNRSSTIMIAKLCGILSRIIPRRIVCCSKIAKEMHTECGYSSDKMIVIGNGFDLERFKLDRPKGGAIRKEIGIPADGLVVGVFARYHPLKDHENFFKAWRMLPAAIGGHPVHALLCGLDVSWDNAGLVANIGGLDPGRIHLLGSRQDLPAFHNALDILCSPSRSEGFPNVVGEAMASGVPCVVTDVGESRDLVAETGLVVPGENPAALGAALLRMLSWSVEDREQAGRASSARVHDHFSIAGISEVYLGLYSQLIAKASQMR